LIFRFIISAEIKSNYHYFVYDLDSSYCCKFDNINSRECLFLKDNNWYRSECTSKDIYDANQRWSVPFDSDCSINLIVPKTWTRNIESAVSLLHYDTISDEFKVFINRCDAFENLNRKWRVHHRRFDLSKVARRWHYSFYWWDGCWSHYWLTFARKSVCCWRWSLFLHSLEIN